MAGALQSYSLSAPGFSGLNTEESPLDLGVGFALVATNCILDQYGRIGARKGWTRVNPSSGTLGANDVGVIHELVQNDGTLTVLFAGNNKLFKLGASNAVTELTYGGGGTAPTITASNWQCASLNGIAYFFQTGHDPLIYDPAVSITTFRRVSEKTGYAGSVPSANIAISAFGRLWVANTTSDKVTVNFSDLIAGHVWSGGTSGSLDVSRVWPNGADEVIGLAAHNDFLFIFGKRQILVYSGASTPASLVLSDTVGSIGCVARDTIQSIGSDVVFLSDSGVRSLMRTIQEKSAPLRDLSKNVRFDLNSSLLGETLANLKSVYSEKEAFYLLVLPATFQVYCFDTKQSLPDGSSRVTKWDSIAPTSLRSLRNGDLYIGKNGYVGKYGGYLDDTSTYRFAYYTNNADLGNANQISILKSISAIVIGGSNQFLTINWGFDYSGAYQAQNIYIPTQVSYEYGVAEYNIAEYTSGIPIKTLRANASGAGKIVQTGYETTINGTQLSLQKIEIQAKDGKLG
jgi:hypothetical protein